MSPSSSRFWSVIVAVFLLIVPIAGLSMADTLEHELFYRVLHWMFWGVLLVGLPFCALVVFAVWRGSRLRATRNQLPPTFSAAKASAGCLALLLFFSGLFTFALCGYANALNALFPTGETLFYRGPVTRLQTFHDKGGWHYELILHDPQRERDLEFAISGAEYSRLWVGAIYERQMQMGCLGVPFQRRW